MASESNDMEMNYREAATFLSNSERTWSGTLSSARVAERAGRSRRQRPRARSVGSGRGQVLGGGQNETCSGSLPSRFSASPRAETARRSRNEMTPCRFAFSIPKG